jgi:hypothetical protein
MKIILVNKLQALTTGSTARQGEGVLSTKIQEERRSSTWSSGPNHTFVELESISRGAVSRVRQKYFSPYTGTTYTVSSGNCPSFSCATSSSLLMLTAGPRDQFPRWRRSRRRLSVCSVLRCPVLWLQCSVSFEQGLENAHYTRITYFSNRARNSPFTAITDLIGLFTRGYVVAFRTGTYSQIKRKRSEVVPVTGRGSP